ncbi:EF-hand domain-containing protein [Kordiimonas sp.]|uniref:EF-hand domain-containing protein n=1 Tax=Kordiimonas sp. TaxID=1970157 RepID=UPI003A8F8E54
MKRVLLISAFAFVAFELSPAMGSDAVQVSDAKKYDEKQTKPKGEDRTMRRRNGGGHSKQAFMETYDLDGDGRVSEQEFYAARDKGYASRDGNGDGSVSPDEYVAEYEVRLDRQLAEQRDRQLKQAYVRFGVLDDDKNGVMTLEEFKKTGKRMFDRLDSNKDGLVDDKDEAERY